MTTIEFSPIGFISTPFEDRAGMPIQPRGARGVHGKAVLYPAYTECLADLNGFSHIYLIYVFHKSSGYEARPIPFLDTQPRGVFSTRAPQRPNAVGLSVVRLLSVSDNVIEVSDVDMLNQTPLLDIKPYIPDFDEAEGLVKTGWLKNARKSEAKRSDNRFI